MPANSKYLLPHAGGKYLADGGLETTLIFEEGLELPHFAAFTCLDHAGQREVLRRYFCPFLEIAKEYGVGFVLETPTWRASQDWGQRLGYSDASLADANREAVRFVESIRASDIGQGVPIVLSGCLGPRGDGYQPGESMTQDEARSYHESQMAVLFEAGVGMITAATLNQSREGIGIAMAARDLGVPVVLSFTLETDGRLPSGESLADVIREIDKVTEDYVSYFGINCAHPTHFEDLFPGSPGWLQRIRSVRGNASKMSHEELDAATELDSGNPDEFGADYERLRQHATHLNVLGGCCGTDHRHVRAVAQRWLKV